MHNDGTFAIQPTQNQTIFHGRAEQGVADQLREIARKTEAEQEARKNAPLTPDQEVTRRRNIAARDKAEAERNAIPEPTFKDSTTPRIDCPRCGEEILASQGVHTTGRLSFDGFRNYTDTRKTCISDIRKAVKSGRTIEKMLSDGLITTEDLKREGLRSPERE